LHENSFKIKQKDKKFQKTKVIKAKTLNKNSKIFKIKLFIVCYVMKTKQKIVFVLKFNILTWLMTCMQHENKKCNKISVYLMPNKQRFY
jgi:hypothetical protein